MTLDHLTERAGRERTLKEKAEQALREGRISEQEYTYFVRKEIGASETVIQDVHRAYAETKRHGERRRETLTKAITAFLFIAIALGALWFLAGHGGPTGLVTFQPMQQVTTTEQLVFTASGDYALGPMNTTAVMIGGTLANGTATVTLGVNGTDALVWHGVAAPPAESVATGKESYALDEPVDVTVTPSNASFTLWLTDGAGVKTLVDYGFVPAAPGAYTLDALLNDSGNISKATTTFLVRNDTNASKDITREAALPSVAFTDACVDTCELAPTGDADLTLRVALSDGATLTIGSVTTTAPRQNHAPVALGTVPDITIEVGESAVIDLAPLFADPDNDTLTYDYMDVPGVAMRVSGSTLTVSGLAAGTGESVIYASDLYSITQSNLFTVTVLPAANATANGTQNATNGTTNATETNATANMTANATTNATGGSNVTVNYTENVTVTGAGNMTTNATNAPAAGIDCSNPDPNKRPLACIQGANSTYFKQEVLLLENKQAIAVGQLTPVGNLLIKGGLVELSAGAPGTSDYQLGYTDADGNFVPTVWIDTATGDLHLKGTLTEANGNLIYRTGETALANERGIILALIDRNTGDMTVRGNIVPYRRSFG